MTREEFRKRNLEEWDNTLTQLFNSKIPEKCVWDNTNDIINVLNVIGQDHNLNHTFLPGGGGLDLYGAGPSVETGCIELYFSESHKMASIVRPNSLIFQSFGKPYELSYFRLESKNLKPSNIYPDYQGIDEELTEIAPGDYAERYYWDEGFYGHNEAGDEIPLPDSARVVSRHFSGSFVSFAKASTYNAISSTYDGRHSEMTSDAFREYVAKLMAELKKQGFA